MLEARRMYGHYAAHARPGLVPLWNPAQARWLWDHLRNGFPDAVATTLMPDHTHFIAPIVDGARRKLAAILGGFASRFGLGEVWQPVPEPQPLASADKVARGARYTLLNPCRPWRGGSVGPLVPDPLVWPWTTLRDVVGAVADPWVDADRLQRALGWGPADFARRFHAYVTSDPHVNVNGTPFPVPALPRLAPEGSLDRVARAALAATRSPAEALRNRTPARRIFLALAYHQGWRQATVLASMCDLHPRAVRRAARQCPPAWRDAAAVCLADPRLLPVEGDPGTHSAPSNPFLPLEGDPKSHGAASKR